MYIILFVCVLFLLYYYLTKTHGYWAKRNVKYDKPVPLFGNLYENVIGVKSITEVSVEMYNKYPAESVVGLYRGRKPVLLVRDLDIARRILVVDFPYFHARGLGRDPIGEPFMSNIFSVDGDTWKLLRQTLTMAFTTAKLKKMFPLIIDCAKKLQCFGDDVIMNKGGECDVRELMARFTIDFIGACGFGIQMDTINNENSLFREVGRKMFHRSWRNHIIVMMWDIFPGLCKYAQKLLAEHEVLDVIEVIWKNLRIQRNYKPCGRNDFVDILLEVDAKGKICGKSIEKIGLDGKAENVEIALDSKLIAAQMYAFFAAGFETSSSSTSYTLHQLAFHPELQAKIQTEIDVVMKKYDNQLCYDALLEMTLLSNSFKEAMRIFPVAGVLHRVCVKQYTIPELGITIDPGVKIIIPMQAIQTDEKYFYNPLVFDPTRFANGTLIRNYTYMPFGEGPRQCIGYRLAEIQSLAGLAAVLHRFTVEPAASTRRQPVINHKINLVQSVQGGMPLKIRPRNTDIKTN